MTAEVIEAEAVELPPERGLVIADVGIEATGALALAALTDEEFDHRLEALVKGRDRVAKIQRALMDKDVDYGLIPGTPKPTLYKPGAEKLCQAYGLVADFDPRRIVGDGESEPILTYETRCELHLGSTTGPVVAVGYGEANSSERKHRYRRGELVCPECGKAGTVLRSKDKPEYFCWRKKGGCGLTFPLSDERVSGQVIGDVENPDPFDLSTTLLKMAEKRAFVDATLRATAASGLFTQDIEDSRPPDPDPATVDRSTGEIHRPERQSPTTPPTEPWLEVANAVVKGVVSWAKPPFDGELRETPDGGLFGFKLAVTGGKLIPQVVAEGTLAADIHDASVEKPLDGQTVIVHGDIYRRPWDKDGKPMPPFQRLVIARIVTDDWSLPSGPRVPSDEDQDELDRIAADLP